MKEINVKFDDEPVIKSELFRLRLPQEDFVIPGLGKVSIRGLSRHEALVMQSGKTPEERDRMLIKFGVAVPALTLDEVSQWQRASTAGELEPMTRRITKLSGMGANSATEAYKSPGGEPNPGV